MGETAPAPPEMQRGHGWRVVRSWPASGDMAKVWEKEREAPLAVQQAAEAPAGRRKLVSTGAFNPPMGEVGTRQLEADQPAERSSAGPLGGAKRVWMGLRFKEMEVRETALVAGQGRRHDILCKGGRWETADERHGSDPRRRAWAHWARWAGRWLLRAVARGGEADGGNGVGGGGVSRPLLSVACMCSHGHVVNLSDSPHIRNVKSGDVTKLRREWHTRDRHLAW